MTCYANDFTDSLANQIKEYLYGLDEMLWAVLLRVKQNQVYMQLCVMCISH